MSNQIKCPKQEFKPCLGNECGWWVPLRGANGETLGRCSVLHIAISLDRTASAMRGGCDECEDCETQEQIELH